jgi:hypothetical protein
MNQAFLRSTDAQGIAPAPRWRPEAPAGASIHRIGTPGDMHVDVVREGQPA